MVWLYRSPIPVWGGGGYFTCSNYFYLTSRCLKGGWVSTLWIYLISSVVEWEEGLTAAATRHFVHLAADKVRVNLAYLDPIYVLPEMELHGLVTNLHIHVSVNDLYIPRIGVQVRKFRKFPLLRFSTNK